MPEVTLESSQGEAVQNLNSHSYRKNHSFWSASPTPFHTDGQLDVGSVKRMIDWHVDQEVDGIMLLGTCGEGPWMPEYQKRILVHESVKAANGRISIAVQVTENSAVRVLEQIEHASEAGADFVAIAQPYFLIAANPARIAAYYREILDRSPLPVIFYDRGQFAQVPVPIELLGDIIAHPSVKIIKDSSTAPDREQVFLEARRLRPELSVLSGDEFHCMDYLLRGYDGLMLGGGIINARHARQIFRFLAEDKIEAARAVDANMCAMQLAVYGGEGYPCWLAGLKHLLIGLGVFTSSHNLLGYTITDRCREEIAELLKAHPDWQ
jgi:4-hydroxy-tetrahydrodipicolinate synthase